MRAAQNVEGLTVLCRGPEGEGKAFSHGRVKEERLATCFLILSPVAIA